MSNLDAAFGITPEAIDYADGARHVLGATILPTTQAEITQRFVEAKKLGAMLPSGTPEKPAYHLDVIDVAKTIDALLKQGLVKAVGTFKSFADMIEALDKDPDVVQNDQKTGEVPHAPDRTVEGLDGKPIVIKAYVQTKSRGAQWAENMDRSGADLSTPRVVMTAKGYELLTGHTQADYPAIAKRISALAAATNQETGE